MTLNWVTDEPAPDDLERADVWRRMTQRAEHAPAKAGPDGLGYGPCVGCGELWPCTSSRTEGQRA